MCGKPKGASTRLLCAPVYQESNNPVGATLRYSTDRCSIEVLSVISVSAGAAVNALAPLRIGNVDGDTNHIDFNALAYPLMTTATSRARL